MVAADGVGPRIRFGMQRREKLRCVSRIGRGIECLRQGRERSGVIGKVDLEASDIDRADTLRKLCGDEGCCLRAGAEKALKGFRRG